MDAITNMYNIFRNGVDPNLDWRSAFSDGVNSIPRTVFTALRRRRKWGSLNIHVHGT